MSLRTKVYEKLPVWGQNAAVSAYGLNLYYERYFNGRKYLSKLLESQWFTAERIERVRMETLRKLLRHANETVPYYRDLFCQGGLDPQKVTTLDDLRRLPLLTKETLRTNSIVSRRFDRKEIIRLNTSGTTGTSLKVVVDSESRRRAYSFTSRYLEWAGLRNGRHNVTFGGRTIVPPGQDFPVFWRYNAAMGNHLFSSYHMSDENLPHYVEKIRSIRPQFIEAYPSAAYTLARFMEENNLGGISPRAVLTSGETLFDYQREVIERVFRCRVFDQYGCTEQAIFVSQCENGAYHVHPEFGIVEILDDDNAPVGCGVTGRVVCTSFMNWAMPLIRYDLGDTAEWDDRPCLCGRHFPIIRRICGRQDDYIITPDGRKVGRLDPIFKGVTSVKLAQIVQTDLSHLLLKIVPGKTFGERDQSSIVAELQARVGPLVQIRVELVPDIEKTRNGKFKAVISLGGA